MTSAATLGAVDFRSDKERTAAYTRGARKQAKRQADAAQQQLKLARQQAKAQRAAGQQQSQAAGAAAASMVDELARLASLHADGALTDEEFAAAKAKLLAE